MVTDIFNTFCGKKHDVFISFSRADFHYAGQITKIMESVGITYTMDFAIYYTGEKATRHFINTLRNCSVFLFIISKASMLSKKRLLTEINYATELNKKILPICVDKLDMSEMSELNLPSDVQCLNLSHITDNNLIETCFLTALSELVGKNYQKNQYDIFISYKRTNKDLVFSIKNCIEQNTGKKCWIDLDGIESDAQFANVIIKAINNAKVFIFMYSHLHTEIEDYDNDWTVREITFAQKKNKRIVFLNVDGSQLTDWFELFFGTKQQIDVSSDFAMDKLYRDLRKWLE